MRTFVTLVIAMGLSFSAATAQEPEPPASQSTTVSATVSPANQVPPLEGGNESGVVVIQLTFVTDDSGAMSAAVIDFEASLRNIQAEDITGLRIHEGATGENGPVVLDSRVGSGGTRRCATGPRS
jgi:hypothetical protein